MQLIQQKSRELLENNPVEKVTNGDNNGASVTAHSDDKPAAEKRKNEAGDNTDNSDGKEDKQQKVSQVFLERPALTFNCYLFISFSETEIGRAEMQGMQFQMLQCSRTVHPPDNHSWREKENEVLW